MKVPVAIVFLALFASCGTDGSSGGPDGGVPADPGAGDSALWDASGLPDVLDARDARADVDDVDDETGDVPQAHDAMEVHDAAIPDDGVIQPPPRPRITVNSIPDSMNGKVPFTVDGGQDNPFRLRVPTGGFTIEVFLPPGTDWTGGVRIESSAVLHPGGSDVFAHEDVSGMLDCDDSPDPMAWADEEDLFTRCTVHEGEIDPAPGVTFGASLVSGTGESGDMDQITVDVVTMPGYLDPFPDTDLWLVVLSRDIFAPKLVLNDSGTYGVESNYVEDGNGKPDLDEALSILGLLSDNDVFSTAAREIFITGVRDYANAIFGLDADGFPTAWSVDLRLAFEGDPDAPDPSKWAPDGGFSMIALGGDPGEAGIENNVVGTAALDWNNQHVEDNTIHNRGVFVTSIVRQVIGNELGALIIKEISPLDGTPLGTYPGDGNFLDPDWVPEDTQDERLKTRYAIYDTIMTFATMAVAATLSHEMGHSLGLVPAGAPPQGLFAGLAGLSFADSDPGSAHVDTPGLNLMQTGKVTSYLEALDGLPRFNRLNTAYLRRRLVVGEMITPP